MVPADCVILQSTRANGEAFVQTDALDGERNLKVKMAPQEMHTGLNSYLDAGNKIDLSIIKPTKDL